MAVVVTCVLVGLVVGIFALSALSDRISRDRAVAQLKATAAPLSDYWDTLDEGQQRDLCEQHLAVLGPNTTPDAYREFLDTLRMRVGSGGQLSDHAVDVFLHQKCTRFMPQQPVPSDGGGTAGVPPAGVQPTPRVGAA